MQDREFRDLVEEVRSRTDIVEVIGHYLTLDRNNKALCPFHDEKTPSFSVNHKGQYFHCFGCGKGGDAFTFLMEYKGWSFFESLKHLAEKAGVELPTLSPEAKRRFQEQRRIGDLLEVATTYYQNVLNNSPDVYDYLRGRGLSDETINDFQLGYDDGGLSAHLQHQNFDRAFIEKTGLVNEKGNDSLYHRVIIPYVERGQVVTFQGRSLPGDSSDFPRYKSLPGTTDCLFNADILKTVSGRVLVTEGELDCICAAQSGLNAVAIPGVNGFKPEWKVLFPSNIIPVIAFDSDAAGQNGTARLIEHLGPLTRILPLPSGLDVNDFIQEHSPDDFHSLVEDAPIWLEQELDRVKAIPENTRPPETQELFKKVAGLNPYERPRFLGKLQEISGFTKAETRAEIERLANQNTQEKDGSISPSVNPGTHKKDATYTACFDGLVEIVEDDGEPAFLVLADKKLAIADRHEEGGIVYVPPPIEQIPWLLPRGEEILKHYADDNDSALYDDLLAHHIGISELPSEDYYHLIVAWDMHTYLLEAFQYSPIICLFAVPERGKSRSGKGMAYVAYRGLVVESLRDPYIIRVAHDLGATLFFDVKNIWRKAERNESEDVLLHRFEKGAQVPRVLYPDRGAHQDIVYYSIFGPTIIGTNEGVHHILGTRAVQINMPETTKTFETDVTPEKALVLKERLVAFRARHMGQGLPDMPKPASGRLGDILRPLIQIIRLVKPDCESNLVRLIHELEKERLMEKSEGFDAQILLHIAELDDQVERGILSIKSITEACNKDKPDRQKVTPQRIGRRLSAMGFKKAKTSTGASAIIWDGAFLARVMGKYGLHKTSEIPETSETPGQGAGNTDVSDVTDVSRIPF